MSSCSTNMAFYFKVTWCDTGALIGKIGCMIIDYNSKIGIYEDLTKIMLWVLIRIASVRRF